ncbi:MAG: hypothetical protein ABIL05_00765 [candidate division WOR-3 bacterium]
MKAEKSQCICPYCCKPVYGDKLFCKPCKIELERCPICGGLKRKSARLCPVCEKKKKK